MRFSFSDLRASLGAGTLLVDVRRKAAFQAAGENHRRALRRDPDAVADWRKTLPRASDVVVYCVHGHDVSQAVAQALERDGLQGALSRRRHREVDGERGSARPQSPGRRAPAG